MSWQYPTDQRDDLGAYAALVGGFWAELFANPNNIQDLFRAYRLAERQLLLQLQELQDTVGRLTCPVLHTQNWFELQLFQSQALPAHPPRADGSQDAAVAYPLPANLLSLSLIANAIAAPTTTWSYGASFTIDPVNHLVIFAVDPFLDPNTVAVPVVNAAGNADNLVTLWGFKAGLDLQYIYQQFGYVFGVGAGLQSSQKLKDLVNAVADSAAGGSSYDALARILDALTGVPGAQTEGEVVQAISQDNFHTLVITDQQAYRFAPGATPLVVVGQVLHKNDRLVDAVQIFEANTGGVPPFLAQLSLDHGLLLADIPHSVVFVNTSVPLLVQTGVAGFTKLTWALGGFPAEVTTFFNDLHNRGVINGATLANYLDTRPPAQRVGQPDATMLPTTINPLRFLFQNVLRNAVVVYMRVSQFGDDALGTGLAWLLRKVMPPQTALILFADLTQVDEAVTMTGVGTATSTGYFEDYSFTTAPG